MQNLPLFFAKEVIGKGRLPIPLHLFWVSCPKKVRGRVKSRLKVFEERQLRPLLPLLGVFLVLSVVLAPAKPAFAELSGLVQVARAFVSLPLSQSLQERQERQIPSPSHCLGKQRSFPLLFASPPGLSLLL